MNVVTINKILFPFMWFAVNGFVVWSFSWIGITILRGSCIYMTGQKRSRSVCVVSCYNQNTKSSHMSIVSLFDVKFSMHDLPLIQAPCKTWLMVVRWEGIAGCSRQPSCKGTNRNYRRISKYLIFHWKTSILFTLESAFVFALLVESYLK